MQIKVLSGDSPKTVAAIARDVGIPVVGVSEGDAIPDEAEARRKFAAQATIVERISPENKQAIVHALRDHNRYVAMVGDGVNDVPALNSSRLAIAQGSGTQMARSVADLVLIRRLRQRPCAGGRRPPGAAQPAAGRQALHHQIGVRGVPVLTIGLGSDAYPLLPRHLSIAATLTIGVPTFFLALAPSTGPWRPDGFVRTVARFAVPVGVIAGAGVVAGYLFALHDLDLSVGDSRTVALTALIACGLHLVMALEAGGSRRRSTLVAGMCVAMAAIYVAALLIPPARSFFALTVPHAGMLATALLAGAVSIAALIVSGFSLRVTPDQPPD